MLVWTAACIDWIEGGPSIDSRGAPQVMLLEGKIANGNEEDPLLQVGPEAV